LNIRANPSVVLLVDHYDDDWDAVWWTRADGTASVEGEGAERDRAVELLTAKYRQYQDGTEPIGAAVVIQVSRWSGWSYT
jgi:PPOX class probable F420-dependent enzyme